MPEGELARRYSALIDELAARHGTPRFHPHVTLLGRCGAGEDASRAAAAVAAAASPFDVALVRPRARDEYYRAVVVEAAPSLELLRLHHLAREALGRLDDPEPFEPHLSLMYGQLGEAQREAVLRALPDVRGRLRVSAISVWRTDGEPSGWREVGRFALAG